MGEREIEVSWVRETFGDDIIIKYKGASKKFPQTHSMTNVSEWFQIIDSDSSPKTTSETDKLFAQKPRKIILKPGGHRKLKDRILPNGVYEGETLIVYYVSRKERKYFKVCVALGDILRWMDKKDDEAPTSSLVR